MLNFSKKYFPLFLLLLFLLLIFARLEKELVFFEDALQKNSDIKIPPKQPLQEKFFSTRSGLTEIEILLGGGKKLSHPEEVKFKLADENCAKVIEEGSTKASFLKIKDLYALKFPKITDSKNKQYCLILEYQPLKSTAKNLQIYRSDEKIALRPGYKNASIWQDIHELSQRISQYKPWFFKHYFLWAIILGFLVLAILLVVVLILI